MEDRVGQVWASMWYEDTDLTHATIFVIVDREDDWVNPHTKEVIVSWIGCVIFSSELEIGRKFVWHEDNLRSGGDSYDNTYERIA